MNWALWLLIPVAVTVLAAIGSWWRSRPKRPPAAGAAMHEHERFLAALGQPARSKDRGLTRD